MATEVYIGPRGHKKWVPILEGRVVNGPYKGQSLEYTLPDGTKGIVGPTLWKKIDTQTTTGRPKP